MNARLLNGRWVSSSEKPLTPYEFKELKDFGDKLTIVYGNNITYDKIELSRDLFFSDDNKIQKITQALNHIKQL
jgi:hypothetical protein